jgi:hypothetical protein
MTATLPRTLKPDLITWLATLPETDPALEAVEAIRRGTGQQEAETPRLLLKEVAEAVGRTPSYLWRLGVPEACGVKNAGGLRYAKGAVLAYLASPECAARVKTLHGDRRSREQGRDNFSDNHPRGRRARKDQKLHALTTSKLSAV